MTAIIDYDAGNVKSVEKALQSLGEQTIVTRDGEVIRRAERVILPGVGAFGDAMDKLERFELIDVIRQVTGQGTPFLGICLGLQLLFDSSEESPGVKGLGILPGRIVRIPDDGGRKVPHIGWNSLTYPRPGRLYEGIPENVYVYFVHSYYLQAREPEIVSAETEYGVRIQASVESGNIFACQFHPEKSSSVGLAILKNFLKTGRG